MFFILGAGIILGYVFLKTPNSTPTHLVKVPSPIPTYSVEAPPSESLRGTIASRSGTLQWESRIATIASELTTDEPMEQGEELITGVNSGATVDFNNKYSLMFGENSDVSFIQTIPIDFVVEQNKGTINYTINNNTPLSIRIRSAILTKTAGSIQVTITEDNPIILISTLQGTAQIGFNDLDYVSQVFTLREGQVYEYNSDERTAINSKNK